MNILARLEVLFPKYISHSFLWSVKFYHIIKADLSINIFARIYKLSNFFQKLEWRNSVQSTLMEVFLILFCFLQTVSVPKHFASTVEYVQTSQEEDLNVSAFLVIIENSAIKVT